MKKLLTLAVITIVMLLGCSADGNCSSCSSDDNAPNKIWTKDNFKPEE